MENSSAQPEDMSLIDLRNVHIEPDLPQEERIKLFVKQIKDPYRYKVGPVVVNVSYANSGATLNDRFVEMLSVL